MPDQRLIAPVWLAPLLLLAATRGLAADGMNFEQLGWTTRAQLAGLPPEQRPVVAPTCSGTWVTPIPPNTKIGDPKLSDIQALAESAQYDPNGASTLKGNVSINQGGRRIDADEALIYQEAGQGTFSGNIRVAEPGLLLTGEKAFYNFSTQEARIERTEFVSSQMGAYGRADEIVRDNNGLITIARGEYSTCEPDNRSWYLVASNIVLNQDTGRGTVRNATLHVQDVPVLYVPYFNFPIDDRRQSGILIPRFGNTNDGGFDLAVPIYLNLAPAYDMTVTPRLINRRGLMGEGEFRYLLPWGGTGTLQGSYLPSDRLYGDQDRKSGSWKHQGQLSDQLSLRTNLNYVSDNAYFTDLGTDLSIANTTHQERVGELLYRADSWSLLGRVQSFQTIDPLIDDFNKPYARLPQLLLNAGQNAPRGLQTHLLAEVTNFQRQVDDNSGPEVNGARLRVDPSVSYDINEPWGFVRPGLKLRSLTYELEGSGIAGDPQRGVTAPVLSLDTGLVFERSTRNYLQTLEPRAYYLFSPYRDQSDLPVFDSAMSTFNYSQLFRDSRFAGLDRLDDSNQVSLGLTSRFIDPDDGSEQFRVSAGQAFYLRDRKVNLTNGPAATESNSGIAAEVAARFSRGWGGTSTVLLSPDREHVSQFSIAANYLPSERDNVLNMGYNYRREDPSLNQRAARQTQLSFVQPAGINWRFVGLWQYDLHRSQSQDALVGVNYESCCWQIGLYHRQFLSDPDDLSGGAERRRTAYFLTIQLKGLAGFGNGGLDGLLGNNVYGYTQLLQREENR